MQEGAGSAYDDRVVRARLAQAFGRLIRRREDRGLFVLLSAAAPTRLMSAFPPGVAIRRLPLAEAIARVNEWLPTGEPIRHEEPV
jgi:ATP-dependent DNA helicase DinG